MAYRVFPMPFSVLWWSACCPERTTLPTPRVSAQIDRVPQQGKSGVYLSRYTSHRRTIPSVRHCHCKLTSEVIRDSNMFVSPTSISVNRLLTTHQPQLPHKMAGKPSFHPEAPVCGHCGDTSCTLGAMTEAV